jgi:hypothetical protein
MVVAEISLVGREGALVMHHDREHKAAALRHANARIAARQEQVAREMADVSARGRLTAEHDRLDRRWILDGITQVSMDP